MTQNDVQADYGQDDLEIMAARLEASGAYRVARRLDLARHLHDDVGEPVWLGIVLDVETTGLDPRAGAECIEIALSPFLYSNAGRITAVLPAFSRLRQPALPIPEAITRLTGITDAMVAGHSIDPDEVAAFVAPADLVIAHNARFDRPFAEAFCPAFASLPWACSHAQVDWASAGHAGSRLVNLLFDAGLFVTAHRALDDCQAVLALLARELPGTGEPAMAALLAAARQPTVRLSAAGAPYAAKDRLKARGYRWNNGDDGRPRAWTIDVAEDAREAEVAFLQAEIFGLDHQPCQTLVTAYDRFSDRA